MVSHETADGLVRRLLVVEQRRDLVLELQHGDDQCVELQFGKVGLHHS